MTYSPLLVLKIDIEVVKGVENIQLTAQLIGAFDFSCKEIFLDRKM